MAEEQKTEVKSEDNIELKQKKAKPSYKSQLEEMKELMQRVQADFENHKKRTEKEKAEFIQYANSKLVLDLLPVLDSFESALKDCDEGTKLIYTQIMQILKARGLKKIESKGQKFDPYKHDAMMVEETDDHEEDSVTDELQSGYEMNNIVLRPAKVKIAKKKNANKENKAQ